MKLLANERSRRSRDGGFLDSPATHGYAPAPDPNPSETRRP